jgi:hypothetical protein
MKDLQALLLRQFPDLSPMAASFRFLPTYDIDMAWFCRHKGLLRNAAGLAGSLFRGAWQEAGEKIQTLSGRVVDPYDAYGRMDRLHESCGLSPLYFFLVAEHRGVYDKNLDPRHPAVAALIRRHAERYVIGLHPSWKSGDETGLLRQEKQLLESLCGQQVEDSRQHYIRFSLPETYRQLIKAGISRDYSMGYGSINGFRASVASPFYWYDLAAEEQTNLQLYPFCFMEANSYYEQQYTPVQALAELRHYSEMIGSVNGTMITIWHNASLGTSRQFSGWWDTYASFVQEVTGKPLT